jgi:hypothetical protein
MQRETLVWTIILVIGALALAGRALLSEDGMGKAYTKAVPVAVDAEHPDGRWNRLDAASKAEYDRAMAADPAQTVYQFSMSRTIGIWVAGLFTLAIFSFLYRDNPFYKIAESVVVGVSAAYWMVVGFWTVIVPNLIGKLWPDAVQSWAMPGLNEERNLWYIVPLILGVMLLWRLAPKGGWIARWPLALFIGVFCGLRLVGYLHGDFLNQIRNAIVPVIVTEDGFDLWRSVRNCILVFGLLACLVYFFFSFEHKGVVGHTARVGIWVLMVTFGAGFGYTVMGRIALLAIRLEFLFDDWLWIIDPTNKRAAAAVVSTVWTHLPLVT